MKQLFIVALVFICLPIVACDNNDETKSADKVIDSFKTIANAWFDQAPEDEPPSPTDIRFDFDANEDPDAFNDTLSKNINNSI